MKILAIIPARAGSKGIPNKNIRLINGVPLISYSIHNALKSKRITDIIVTTDSPEVRIIAEQLGVNVHWRKKELCKDDVTLDAVVYDAIDQTIKWDYIITMQPTSPSLTVKTLDKAIDFAIKNKLDTLISAINAPHLSWREEKGEIVPNYKKRLNRQYLPANYLETGAFVISKASVVTAKTRIGKKVSVFEVPENESQDVDTFSDLLNVELSLRKEKVAIYVNGNNSIGTGHVYRALELADLFYSKPDIYYDKRITDKSIFGTTTHNLIGVDGNNDLINHLTKEEYTLVINDILSTAKSFIRKERSAAKIAKIVNFEDDGDGAKEADLVINALYDISTEKNMHVGEKYYICGKLFTLYQPIRIKEKVKKVFICFGGADPQNYTNRILNIITSDRKYNDYHFTVVIGKAKKDIKRVMSFNKYENIDVYYDVSNMPELMSKCDIAITSRGRTGYELAILGIPTIAMAQNEREEKHGFICNENGFTYIGLKPSDEIIQGTLDMYLKLSKSNRMNFQSKLLVHNLKDGRKHIKSLLDSF